MRRLVVVAALVSILAACGTQAQVTPRGTCHLGPGGRPDRTCTPGALNPAVTQATLGTTVCVPGWTATVRPPTGYTNPLKVRQIRAYGYTDTDVRHYEEDHLIPLELGGAPRDERNLWPEAHPGSATKDRIENQLKQSVCAGLITLDAARTRILADWGP